MTIATFSQNDPRWADKQLGSCTDTIGQSGCYLTAFACFAAPHHLEVDPNELNGVFRDRGIYVGGCLLPDDALEQVFPELQLVGALDCSGVPAPLDQLAATDGQVVFVDLRKDGMPNHFVPIWQADSQDPLILDVYDGQVKRVSAYGDPATVICKVIRYAYVPPVAPAPVEPAPAPPPTTTPAPPAPEVLAQLDSAIAQLEAIRTTLQGR